MLKYVVFVMLLSFSEWLWAGSSCAAVCCPVKPVKKTTCPLQKKLYVEVGISKTLNTHLSSAQRQIITEDKDELNLVGVYPMHRGTGIFPNTMQIGVGYAWFRNTVNGRLLPYASVGVEYRQINPMHSPLTLTAKVSGDVDKFNKKGSSTYKGIPLENSHLFATAKINPVQVGCVFPYVSAGLGMSWTQAYNQQLNKLSIIKEDEDQQIDSFHFPAIKQSNLGFRLGAGFDFALTQNLLMSLGYSYNNLGKLMVHKPSFCSNYKSEEDQHSPVHDFPVLHLGSLTSHNVEFSLRYLF